MIPSKTTDFGYVRYSEPCGCGHADEIQADVYKIFKYKVLILYCGDGIRSVYCPGCGRITANSFLE